MNDPDATAEASTAGDEDAYKFARFERVVLPRIMALFLTALLMAVAAVVLFWHILPARDVHQPAAALTPNHDVLPAAQPQLAMPQSPTAAGARSADSRPVADGNAAAQLADRVAVPTPAAPAIPAVPLFPSPAPTPAAGVGELAVRPPQPAPEQRPDAPAVKRTIHRASMPAAVSVDDPVLRQMIELIEKCDIATVLAAYNRAYAIAPRNVAMNRAFVRRMLELGRPRMALDAARTLTQVDEGNPIGWAVCGYCWAKRGDYPAAMAALVKALDLGHSDPGVQSDVGQLLAWYDAQKPPVPLPDETRRIIDESRGDWARTGRFAQGYEKMASAIRQQAEDQAEYQRKLAAAQQELDNLQQNFSDLAGNYWRILGEIEVHRNNIDSIDPRLYSAADYNAMVDKEKAAIALLKGQAQAIYAGGQTAASAIKNKQAEIARMKEPAKVSLQQMFLFDPPAVDGVITLETRQPLAAVTTRPALSVDPEFDASQEMELAKLYISNGMNAKAVVFLDDIIARFPRTKAAAEARQMRVTIGEQVRR